MFRCWLKIWINFQHFLIFHFCSSEIRSSFMYKYQKCETRFILIAQLLIILYDPYLMVYINPNQSVRTIVWVNKLFSRSERAQKYSEIQIKFNAKNFNPEFQSKIPIHGEFPDLPIRFWRNGENIDTGIQPKLNNFKSGIKTLGPF